MCRGVWVIVLVFVLVTAGFAQQLNPRQLPPGVTAYRNLTYAQVCNTTLKLDLFIPPATAVVPVVLWIHGGGWQSGSKEQNPALPLTAQGFAVASINYRLTDVAIFPAQIHDCKAAVRWLRANAKTYRIDPDHIGAWGASAGGHLSALLGTSGGVKELEGEGNPDYSSRVQAVCDFFGPADFLAWFKTNPNRVSNADAPESKLMGGPLRDHLEKAKLASPITHIDKDDPPFLIVHGDKDMVVPVSQSQRFHTALQQAKVDSTLMIVNGAGHGGAGMQTPAISAAVVAFFQKHLMP